MTKQLAQYSVPAENSRVIRVFLSSTFRDMEMERSALVKLFKGLQVKAASRGATISLVDLRWGITEEDAKSGKATAMDGVPVMKIYLKLSMTAWNIVG